MSGAMPRPRCEVRLRIGEPCGDLASIITTDGRVVCALHAREPRAGHVPTTDRRRPAGRVSAKITAEEAAAIRARVGEDPDGIAPIRLERRCTCIGCGTPITAGAEALWVPWSAIGRTMRSGIGGYLHRAACPADRA